MKIFNLDQIRQADKITIERQEITGYQLMERAGFRLFQRLREEFLPVKGKVIVFCGIGNNGGDGLIIARQLLLAKYPVEVYVVNFSEHRTEDMQESLHNYREAGGRVSEQAKDSPFPEIRAEDLVVDAIFGIGLNRQPPDWVEQLIVNINAVKARVVAIDIPSGLPMQGLPWNKEAVICAAHTYTIELPKLGLLLPDTGQFTRDWSIVSIDLDAAYIATEPTPYYYTEMNEMAALVKPRVRFSHKGDYGHALICGGSLGKIGAALMCAEAALTAGSGLVSALVPGCGYQVFQTAVPEVMCVPADCEYELNSIRPDFDPDVVAIGPGMGTTEATCMAMKAFLKSYDGKLVLDADALNLIAEHPEIWDSIPENTVITPHPGEFRRLADPWQNDRERLDRVMLLAREKKVIVVLKGAYTVVTNGAQTFFNSTGNPGMATGGSGDVLTGIIASLLGQGYDALAAARLGVCLHGLAADIAIRDTSQWSLTATDIIDYLGDAYLYLTSARTP